MSTHAHAEAVPARDEIVLYLAGFSFISAIIHVVAAAEHYPEVWWYGVFFTFLAGFQLVWGFLVYSRATPRLLIVGAAVSLAVALIWTLSRTLGVPFGPEAFDPESVGAIDVASTIDELAIVGLVAVALLSNGRPRFSAAGRNLVYVLLIGSALSLFLAGHHH